MQIRTRPASTNDKPTIFALYREAMQGYIERIFGWDDAWQLEAFEKSFNSAVTRVIENDSGIAGYYQVEFPDEATEYLCMLIIRPNMRSRGIGRQILEMLQEEAHETSKAIKLRVFRINSGAKRFYMKYGWTVMAEEEEFYLLEKRSLQASGETRVISPHV